MALSTTPQSFNMAIELGFNTPGDLLRYIESSSTTAAAPASSVVTLTANTNDQAVSLATLFPGLTQIKAWGFKDISNPGVQLNWKLTSGSADKLALRAGGSFAQAHNSTTVPTIYFDNTSLTQAANLLVVAIGS